MADLPELQRRLLQRSRLLGFEPWSDSPLRQTGDRSSSDSDSSGDDIDCEEQWDQRRYFSPFVSWDWLPRKEVLTTVPQILRQHKALIDKIKTMIRKGNDVERNLTSLRRVVARKLRRETNRNKRKQLQNRMDELTRLITNLRDRNTKVQTELNDFYSKVASGQITSKREAYKILNSIYKGQVVPLNNLANKAKILTRKITNFIKKVVQGIGGI
ncbi:hypothetical protein HPB47_000175, partial [Ixodes persulcatus]